MKRKLLIMMTSLLFATQAEDATMTHGPSVFSEQTTANFFARTDVGASVDFEYSVNSNLSGSIISGAVTTVSGSDYTAQKQIVGLTANTTYYYTPRVDT